MTFESVSIGPTAGEPTRFVPVDVASEPTAVATPRMWIVALGLGVAFLFAAAVWVSTRPTPAGIESWYPTLPNNPTEAFVWDVPSGGGGEDQVFFAGSADEPYIMTVGPESGTIYALDDAGSERWRAPVENDSWLVPFPYGDTIVVAAQNFDRDRDGGPGITFTGLRSDDGEEMWQTTGPGNHWALVDRHLVIVGFPDEVLDGFDDDDEPVVGPVSVYSIDLSSGERSPQRRYDEVYLDGRKSVAPLVRDDGQLFTIDGSLNRSSTPVPEGNRGAAFDGESIITFDDATVTVYDTSGTTLRSASGLPEGLDGTRFWNLVGAGSDRWMFTTDDFDCGVVRFSADDAELVELWRQESCLAFMSFPIADLGADGDGPSRYAVTYDVDDESYDRIVDVETGSVIAEGESLVLGTNGTAVFDGKHIIGQSFRTDRQPEPLFELPATADDWQLLGGAIAIGEHDDDGKPISVTVYR